jgi:chemotaxis protein MotA|tara:strand:+ start:415 stop:1188 length:774 start_codon:yes stop_codon:yes gene_type:complete
MDIATVIGLVGTMGLIFWAMDSAAGIGAFLDPASMVIVFAGSLMVLLMRSTLPDFINAWAKVLMKTILNKNEDASEIIEQIVSMANISRRDGVIALEGQMGEIQNAFLQTGIGMVVDGTDAETIESKLNNDLELMTFRHANYSGVFKSWKDIAPAMGMIGTLVGLVGMLQNMSDPKAIGPAMAIALLTTLYGALIANVLAGPLAEKLDNYSADEQNVCALILEGVIEIRKGTMNPRVLEDVLKSRLSPAEREKFSNA